MKQILFLFIFSFLLQANTFKKEDRIESIKVNLQSKTHTVLLTNGSGSIITASGELILHRKKKFVQIEDYKKEGREPYLGRKFNLVKDATGVYTLLHKNYSEFFPDGQLSFQRKYKNGIPIGDVKMYQTDGVLSMIDPYKRGKNSGKRIWNHSDGTAKTIGWLENGRRTKKWVTYYENGELESKGKYTPENSYFIINNSHDKILLLSYENSDTLERKPITKKLLDSLNSKYGNSQSSGAHFPMPKYLKDKTWTYYSKEGKLIKTEFWKKGMLINTVKNE